MQPLSPKYIILIGQYTIHYIIQLYQIEQTPKNVLGVRIGTKFTLPCLGAVARTAALGNSLITLVSTRLIVVNITVV